MLIPYVGHIIYECYTYIDVLYDVLCVYIFMIIWSYTCLYVYIHAYHMLYLVLVICIYAYAYVYVLPNEC